MRRLEDSRRRFESAWRDLGEAVETGTGFRPRMGGLGLLVLGVSAGLALSAGGKILWTEFRRADQRLAGDRSEVADR